MLANVFISLIFCAVCTLAYYGTKVSEKNKYSEALFALLVLGAVAIRLFFAMQNYCFESDVNTFKAWGSYAHSYGFKQLYSQDIFLDYPPGYIYILWLLDRLCAFLGIGWQQTASTFIFKLPAMVADFALAGLIYNVAKEKGKGFARFSALVFLCMPVVVLNSSIWGQIESWYLLFVALSIYFASKNKTVPAAVSYAVALITKPQALMFGPVLLFYIIKRKSLKEFLKAAGTGLAALYAFALPFCPTPFEVSWLVNLYKNTMEGYRCFTVNAYNIYYTLGLNWADTATARFDNINTFVIVSAVAVAAFIMFKGRGKEKFYCACGVLVVIIFAFCTMMHERYLYPAVLFFVLAFAAGGRAKHLALSLGFGALCFFNSACALSMYYPIFQLNSWAGKAAGAAVTLGAAACVIALTAEIIKENKQYMKKYFTAPVIVAAITAVYALVAFTGLGSFTAPQTFYQSTQLDNSVIIDFEQPSDLSAFYVYSGLGDQFAQPQGQKVCGEFEVYCTTADGITSYLCDITGQSVYTWKQYPNSLCGVTSVEIRAKTEGAVLHEIVFEDSSGNTLKTSVRYADSTNPYNGANAVDESHIKADTSYYSSMYFDEIYHGRTAYEQLMGYQIYETTHPPLGKILIGVGIQLFGMTPFGWRFTGALCGVIMLPLIYLFAKAIGGRKAGVAACGLMALDFMHLTQTRIATVDTFVVLFVMVSFLFMVYYHKAEFGNIKREWLYLLLSGVAMGCAVSSKWNGAYPMVALALFFFISLFFKYKNSPKTGKEGLYIAKTLLFCCVAFVAIPLVIYTLSYLPAVTASGTKDFIRQVIGYQTHMYNYHSTLDAEHFFSSMWYSWPLCIKPVWYAVAQLPNGFVSTISAFGNPLIWIATPAAALWCMYKGIREKRLLHLFVAMGYLASYIPWVAVSRLCFIYHYFPCAMFGIVALAVAIKELCDAKAKYKKAAAVYFALCLVAFIVFLPVTTGWGAPKGYVEFLELMPSWYFIN